MWAFFFPSFQIAVFRKKQVIVYKRFFVSSRHSKWFMYLGKAMKKTVRCFSKGKTSYSFAICGRLGKPRLFVTLKTMYSFSCAFSVQDLHWIITKGFVSLYHVSHGEKLTRSNARKIQDSNANVDKFELKYKALCRKNVIGVNA